MDVHSTYGTALVYVEGECQTKQRLKGGSKMETIRNYQTCMSSFISLLLAATNLLAISFLIMLFGKAVMGI